MSKTGWTNIVKIVMYIIQEKVESKNKYSWSGSLAELIDPYPSVRTWQEYSCVLYADKFYLKYNFLYHII